MNTIRTMRTTTLKITKPSDYSILESQFRLVRYIVPDDITYRDKRFGFDRVHNSFKEQLNYPYKSFKHDYLESHKKWVVYVLYPKDVETKDIKLEVSHGSQEILSKGEVSFGQIPLHILLKLLHINRESV